MSSLIQILGGLLALVASGYSLSCTQCYSTGSSCSGSSVVCPADTLCGAQYTQTTVSGSKYSESYTMSCLPKANCYMRGSLSYTQNLKLKTGSSCCGSDNCTPTFPSLPMDSSVSNGLTCRSCISADSPWCYTSDTMQCTGEENMCLLQTTKITGSQSASTALRGCATQSICDLGSQSSSANGITTDVSFICTTDSGSTNLQKGFYLPAVLCFFLLKLLI